MRSKLTDCKIVPASSYNKTIYCDLDGVLFNFEAKLKSLFGEDLPSDKTLLWAELSKTPDLYRNLDAYKGAYLFWKQLEQLASYHNFNLCILTAIPRRTSIPRAELDKYQCALNYFGDLNFKIGPFAKDKKNHCNEGDILIDDKEQNIVDWNSKKGFGILHFSNSQSSNFEKSINTLTKYLERNE